MFSVELKRLLKSRATMVLVVLIGISIVSFLISYGQRQIWIDRLNGPVQDDLNAEAVKEMIQNSKGLAFYFSFIFSGDFGALAFIIKLLWVGIFLSPILLEQKNNGFGNFLLSRESYTKMIHIELCAQTVYIFIIVFSEAVIQIVIAGIVGGMAIPKIALGNHILSGIEIFIIIVGQGIMVGTFLSFVNGIVMLGGEFLSNKYILQALPLIVFYVIPNVFGSILSNMFQGMSNILINYSPEYILDFFSNMYQNNFEMGKAMLQLFPFVTYGLIFCLLYRINKRQYINNYL